MSLAYTTRLNLDSQGIDYSLKDKNEKYGIVKE